MDDMTTETPGMRGFNVLKTSARSSARHGRYSLPHKRPLETPAMILTTSRGMVPHLTPDHLQYLRSQDTNIAVQYSAEDFMDKLPDVKKVPFLIYGQNSNDKSIEKGAETGGRKAKDLVSIPDDIPVITSVRRPTPIASPKSNSNSSISIMTSEGFRYLDLPVYYEFVSKFGADITISPADVPNLSPGGHPGTNRVKNMIKRTGDWLTDLLLFKDEYGLTTDVFGSLLPSMSLDKQLAYLDVFLEHQEQLTGVVFQANEDDATVVGRLPEKKVRYEHFYEDEYGDLALSQHKDIEVSHLAEFRKYIDDNSEYELVRMFSSAVTSPHEALELVSEGMDLLFVDFVNLYTDAGVALDFKFDGNSVMALGLGHNLWDPTYVTDMSGLGDHVTTKYGQSYHKAYIHHLLQAHEMAAWILLQLHNAEVCEQFFQDIRMSIDDGTFEEKKRRFVDIYGDHKRALALRDQYVAKGRLPKLRGHRVSLEQEKKIKLQGRTEKFNDPAYRKL